MIYFIQDASTLLIKIGFTDSAPEKRLAQLQTGCPGELMLLLMIEGGQNDEADLHERFDDLRERGEWFRPGPMLIGLMIDLRAKQHWAEGVDLARSQMGAMYATGVRNGRALEREFPSPAAGTRPPWPSGTAAPESVEGRSYGKDATNAVPGSAGGRGEMDAETIRAMPAGREMDALVAERVMGANPRDVKIVGYGPTPHYSTDIAAAMDVLCKAREGEPLMITAGLMDGSDQYKGQYYCSILQVEAFGDTISHAICRAALLATLE